MQATSEIARSDLSAAQTMLLCVAFKLLMELCACFSFYNGGCIADYLNVLEVCEQV